MVLLSLPFAPVVVLKSTVPLLALVFTLCRVRNLSVLPLASLMNRTATPLVLVLAMVSCLSVPTPPGRPSKVTNCAPFKSTVAAVVSALLIVSGETTSLAGRIVSVFAAVVPRLLKLNGKLSPLLSYPACNSRITGPSTPSVCTALSAAPRLAYSPVGPTECVP